MENAIAYLVVFALIGLMFWALIREHDQKRKRSVEEYERDVAEAKESLMRAGMLELDKFVGNVSGKTAAVEYLKDEEQGMTKTGGKDDEDGRTEAKK
ncbi:MAG: hypothetical protein AB1631_29050 [Acidobacteriota bacterium]